ncbi:hypothetical protein SAMN06295926_102181 [Lysinibacillus sp. AC-3]|nr:hypothetical protein SAMN06295926_102181 [Lysinibacillus sp. AC-3]
MPKKNEIYTVKLPSTETVAPAMKLTLSEAKNRTASATSSGSPLRQDSGLKLDNTIWTYRMDAMILS